MSPSVEQWYIGTKLESFQHGIGSKDYSLCMPRFVTPSDANEAFLYLKVKPIDRDNVEDTLGQLGTFGVRVQSFAKEMGLFVDSIKAHDVKTFYQSRLHSVTSYAIDDRQLLVYVDPQDSKIILTDDSRGQFTMFEPFHDEEVRLCTRGENQQTSRCQNLEPGDALFFRPITCHHEYAPTGYKTIEIKLSYESKTFEEQARIVSTYAQ